MPSLVNLASRTSELRKSLSPQRLRKDESLIQPRAGDGYGDALTIVQRDVIIPASRKRLVPVDRL